MVCSNANEHKLLQCGHIRQTIEEPDKQQSARYTTYIHTHTHSQKGTPENIKEERERLVLWYVSHFALFLYILVVSAQ